MRHGRQKCGAVSRLVCWLEFILLVAPWDERLHFAGAASTGYLFECLSIWWEWGRELQCYQWNAMYTETKWDCHNNVVYITPNLYCSNTSCILSALNFLGNANSKTPVSKILPRIHKTQFSSSLGMPKFLKKLFTFVPIVRLFTNATCAASKRTKWKAGKGQCWLCFLCVNKAKLTSDSAHICVAR